MILKKEMKNDRKKIKEPKVTFFTLIYNSGEYVIPALEALKKINYSNYEHIIVDDASSDNSVELLRSWLEKNKSPCTLILNEENLGITKNLNKILELAKGKYLAGVCDDIIYPEFLNVLIPILERNRSASVAYGDCRVVDVDGKIILPSYFSMVEKIIPPRKGQNFKRLLFGNFIPAPCCLFSLDHLKQIGGWDESLFFEDWDMWLRMADKGFDLIPVDVGVCDYVRRPGSTSSNKKKMTISSVKTLVKWMGINNEFDRIIRGQVLSLAFKYLLHNKILFELLEILVNAETKDVPEKFKIHNNSRLGILILKIKIILKKASMKINILIER